jgi:threonine dehydratase
MDNAFRLPSLKEVKEAANRITGYIHNTPVLTSEILNNLVQAELYFKCENFQKSGAFKFRGACNTLLGLKENGVSVPVITHSSGNHAGALAKASALLGFTCYVVMPSNAPQVKVDAVKYYGGDIHFCEPTLRSREENTRMWIQRTEALLIHPYNNVHIVEGQGTAALELLNEKSSIEIVLAPVGGGGLLSGTAIAAKGINAAIMVYGAEPKGADDAYRSLKSGRLIPSEDPKTIADGLLTSLGDITFQLISRQVDDIFTVKEESIIHAMRLIWQYLKIIVEPSSAVPLAVVLENTGHFAGHRIGIILSGGNVDLNRLPF